MILVLVLGPERTLTFSVAVIWVVARSRRCDQAEHEGDRQRDSRGAGRDQNASHELVSQHKSHVSNNSHKLRRTLIASQRSRQGLSRDSANIASRHAV